MFTDAHISTDAHIRFEGALSVFYSAANRNIFRSAENNMRQSSIGRDTDIHRGLFATKLIHRRTVLS